MSHRLRHEKHRRTFTPNQVVAYNMWRGRLLRDWTQDEAAEAVAPYLGTRLSAASWSAAERSVEGVRIREFNADELLALARGFGVPIGWFLTPPPVDEEIGLATPDAGREGLDPVVLLDALLGTEETLPYLEDVLAAYTGFTTHHVLIDPEGVALNLGREQPRMQDRLQSQVALRAKLVAEQAFGDVRRASATLRRLADVLDEIGEVIDETGSPDQVARTDTNDQEATPKRARRTHSERPRET
ncbi:MAG: helix-turn-helix transcriptional regulator [Acidimicrobiales bacterium]|jgi:hypothetical protein